MDVTRTIFKRIRGIHQKSEQESGSQAGTPEDNNKTTEEEEKGHPLGNGIATPESSNKGTETAEAPEAANGPSSYPVAAVPRQ